MDGKKKKGYNGVPEESRDEKALWTAGSCTRATSIVACCDAAFLFDAQKVGVSKINAPSPHCCR
ncbi:hypothetical protein COY95_01025 [Candidatus Woesearchaeota archaeon CG_4_10_14_0_8_um_filter_47_5]|nr:MAG: hypothetical protein COY95_01025 [Candidatus Woesearchaeota archaeon CG_4_10_14_0_8_um_filter_47_5]